MALYNTKLKNQLTGSVEVIWKPNLDRFNAKEDNIIKAVIF
jgi:hypothetical protein